MSFWTYMLRCADGSYYTGHTDNLEQRIAMHLSRNIPECYTATRLPVRLVFSQEFSSRQEALAAERQIKGWSRAKKEALIRGDWAALSKLAKGRTDIADSVRAELVEARPSTGSGRTGFENDSTSRAVRAAPVEAYVSVRAAPVEAHVSVHAEPVEVRPSTSSGRTGFEDDVTP